MTAPESTLVRHVREVLGPRHDVAGVGLVQRGVERQAVLGADEDADFEIGSISKGVTGLLLHEALRRGEVTASSTLADHLPLERTPVGAVRLADLATHRSGLPRLPASSRPWRRTVALWRHGTNPYGESVDELLDQARRTPPGPPRPRYSNLGFELLGHALAAAAGTTYGDLVTERVARPLGLDGLYVPVRPTDLRPGAVPGRSRRGRVFDPWTGEAVAPAGGIRATVGAMTRLAAALADGSAPGVGALEPVAPLSRRARVGAGWITVEVGGRAITWHNGGTGGFRSWLGVDRAQRTAVVVLTSRAVSVDRAGFRLLAEP